LLTNSIDDRKRILEEIVVSSDILKIIRTKKVDSVEQLLTDLRVVIIDDNYEGLIVK